ncbi:hypothetical protein ABBQ38_001792 [Trebouxia sp. C0009 RCD-2024]
MVFLAGCFSAQGRHPGTWDPAATEAAKVVGSWTYLVNSEQHACAEGFGSARPGQPCWASPTLREIAEILTYLVGNTSKADWGRLIQDGGTAAEEGLEDLTQVTQKKSVNTAKVEGGRVVANF